MFQLNSEKKEKYWLGRPVNDTMLLWVVFVLGVCSVRHLCMRLHVPYSLGRDQGERRSRRLVNAVNGHSMARQMHTLLATSL